MPQPPIRSFGRTKSRTLKPRQAGLLETLLPKIAISDPADGLIDVDPLLADAAEMWLEIGFGGGEHMAAQAGRRPDVLVLGAEPFQNGAASTLRHIDETGLQNVRLHVGDARALMDALPAGCLSRIFILFPDPWPKTRHHKRRLIQPDVIETLARLLKPGGDLRFATDWEDYADWSLQRFIASPAFAWTAMRASDWRGPPADHVTTRYEEKKLGDIAPLFFDFVRR